MNNFATQPGQSQHPLYEVRFNTKRFDEYGFNQAPDDFQDWIKLKLLGHIETRTRVSIEANEKLGVPATSFKESLARIGHAKETLRIVSAEGPEGEAPEYLWTFSILGHTEAQREIFAGGVYIAMVDFAHKRAFNVLYDHPPEPHENVIFQEVVKRLALHPGYKIVEMENKNA